jgi:hypothetical protein
MAGWTADPEGLPDWAAKMGVTDAIRECLYRCERWPGLLFQLPHPTETYGR